MDWGMVPKEQQTWFDSRFARYLALEFSCAWMGNLDTMISVNWPIMKLSYLFWFLLMTIFGIFTIFKHKRCAFLCHCWGCLEKIKPTRFRSRGRLVDGKRSSIISDLRSRDLFGDKLQDSGSIDLKLKLVDFP